MKAITLWQPWASLVAVGVKTIETRSWSTSYRGPIAIHAGARPLTPRIKREYYGIQPHAAYQSGLVHGPAGARVCNALDRAGYKAADGSDLPLGAVVATCTLTDVVPILDRFDSTLKFEHPAAFTRAIDDDVIVAGGDNTLPLRWPSQRPYGDFTPGRYAWLLDDIVRLDEPIPARGHQQLWNWSCPVGVA